MRIALYSDSFYTELSGITDTLLTDRFAPKRPLRGGCEGMITATVRSLESQPVGNLRSKRPPADASARRHGPNLA